MDEALITRHLTQNLGADLARMIIDVLFGQPLRRLQQFFRNRQQRQRNRETATSMRSFNAFAANGLRNAIRSLDPTRFRQQLDFLGTTMPDVAGRIVTRMSDSQTETLFDSRRPGNLALLRRFNPGFLNRRIVAAQQDYERSLRGMMEASWGLTDSDLTFKYMNPFR